MTETAPAALPNVPPLNMSQLRSGTQSHSPVRDAVDKRCGDNSNLNNAHNGELLNSRPANGQKAALYGNDRVSSTTATRPDASSTDATPNALPLHADAVRRALAQRVSVRAGSVLTSGTSSLTMGARRLTLRLPARPAPPALASYSTEVAKTIRELLRRREEAVLLRVLPKHHLVQAHILQEQCQRELNIAQEAAARAKLWSRMNEERLRLQEQQIVRRQKLAQEALKQQQVEELNWQRELVNTASVATEAEVRERVQALALLQPRLGVVQAALADCKDEQHDYALVADLFEEERRLQKALKADARYDKPRSADIDGGALPYWFKHCIAASFNVAAILKRQPCRASVEDLPAPLSEACKLASERKAVVLRDEAGAVQTIAHVRCGPDCVVLAESVADLCAAVAEKTTMKNGQAPCCLVLWPKDTLAELSRKLRVAGNTKPELQDVLQHSATTLTCGELSSYEMNVRDIQAAGNAASASNA